MIPQSEQDIAGALEFTAAWMIRGSGRIYPPPDDRRNLLRYSPYLRELAVRPACCARILSVDAEEEEWPHELIGAFLPIVAELRLPIRAPYQADVWAELLGEVRLGGGSGEAVEPIPRSAEVEIQFVFEEWTEPFAPIVPRYIKVAHVVLDLRHTRPELYDELVGTCDEVAPLASVRTNRSLPHIDRMPTPSQHGSWKRPLHSNLALRPDGAKAEVLSHAPA